MARKIPQEPTALICGSVAYDTILVFPDRFKSHILPDKLNTLNVSFLVPEMRREFGGCAANIAYGLHLLGDKGPARGAAARVCNNPPRPAFVGGQGGRHGERGSLFWAVPRSHALAGAVGGIHPTGR